MRSYITVMEKQPVVDNEGGRQEDISAVWQGWTSITSPSGGERWMGEQLRSEVDSVCKIRIQAEGLVKAGMVVIDRKGRKMNLLICMVDDQDPRFLRLGLRQYREENVAAPQPTPTVPAET